MGHMSKTPRFSDDFPSDAIYDNPCLDDPGVARLAAWVGRYPHKASATRYGFRRFRALLEAVQAPWKDELVRFTDAILAGTYRREFGKTYNRRAGGGVSWECSQTSELFSLFTQAVHYKLKQRELFGEDEAA